MKQNTRKVLFTDDESSILRAFKRLFRKEDFEVITADSFDRAMDEMQKEALDVIITDFRMPGKDGVEVLTEAQRLHPHSQRVILSGYFDAPKVNNAMKQGIVMLCLYKPWDDIDLKIQVKQLLSIKE